MDPNYKAIRQQADSLHNKYLGMRDDRNNPTAVWLEAQTKEIREDIERSKPPRAVENRINEVRKRLEHAKSEPSPAISPQDAASLENDYEHLREKLRSLPNY